MERRNTYEHVAYNMSATVSPKKPFTKKELAWAATCLVRKVCSRYTWARDVGIRHSRGNSRGYRNWSYYSFQPKNRGTLDCYFRRNKRVVGLRGGASSGQASVEYAVVTAALLILAVVVGMMASRLEAGLWIEHAVISASHSVQGSIGWIADIFSY